ncbi:MAG: hypothetical protein KC656_18485 [Myxococcales bacterium]|nr:hypothetical protein [Myxococcales bacterium]
MKYPSPRRHPDRVRRLVAVVVGLGVTLLTATACKDVDTCRRGRNFEAVPFYVYSPDGTCIEQPEELLVDACIWKEYLEPSPCMGTPWLMADARTGMCVQVLQQDECAPIPTDDPDIRPCDEVDERCCDLDLWMGGCTP